MLSSHLSKQIFIFYFFCLKHFLGINRWNIFSKSCPVKNEFRFLQMEPCEAAKGEKKYSLNLKYKLMKNETAVPGALADSSCSWKYHLTHLCNLTLGLFCFTDVDEEKKNLSILLILSQEHMLHMQALDQRAQETNLEHWLNPHCYPRCDRNYGYPVWRRELISALHPYCQGLNIFECLSKFTHIPASKSESSSFPTTASLAVIRRILTHPLPRRSCCAAVASLPFLFVAGFLRSRKPVKQF